MVYVFVVVLSSFFCSSLPKGHKPKEKQQSRPWYDISYDDIIKYDMFDDD